MKTKKSKKGSKAKKSSKGEVRGNDIVRLILQDHKSLKSLIKVMKNSEKELSDREQAFLEFAPLLLAHAKPEEKVLYKYLKSSDDLKEEGFEGEVEHTLADQLVEEAKRAKDENKRSALIKTLAEVVEHHIEEEESPLLPDFKKSCDSESRISMGEKFLELKQGIEEEGSDDAPPEKYIPSRELHF